MTVENNLTDAKSCIIIFSVFSNAFCSRYYRNSLLSNKRKYCCILILSIILPFLVDSNRKIKDRS